MTSSDPVTLLIRLRAEMVRLAGEVEDLADVHRRPYRRAESAGIARRMRDAAMTSEMVAACQRVPDAAFNGAAAKAEA